MGDSDRRQHRRYKLWVPARIEGQRGRSRLAVGHDISQKGSLLVTREPRPAVGDLLRLYVKLPPDGDEERAVTARVVRSEANEADPDGLWPVRIAVEFDQAEPELEALVAAYEAAIEGELQDAPPPPSSARPIEEDEA